MWLSDRYDVPQALVDDPPSPAFRQYLLNWFGSNRVSLESYPAMRRHGDAHIDSSYCESVDKAKLTAASMR
jgi:hypothetical protein